MLQRNKMTQYVIQARGQKPASTVRAAGLRALPGDGVENYYWAVESASVLNDRG